jgi:hypothetical protein
MKNNLRITETAIVNRHVDRPIRYKLSCRSADPSFVLLNKLLEYLLHAITLIDYLNSAYVFKTVFIFLKKTYSIGNSVQCIVQENK